MRIQIAMLETFSQKGHFHQWLVHQRHLMTGKELESLVIYSRRQQGHLMARRMRPSAAY